LRLATRANPLAHKRRSARNTALAHAALLAFASLGSAAFAAGQAREAASAQPARNADANASGQAHWFDHGRRRALRVDPDWVADFRDSKPRFERRDARASRPESEKAAPLAAGVSPVLRDETGAARALPGGVIVRLREADLADPRKALADAGLEALRPIDPEERTWLVASPAGLETLDLANRLHESGRFESVTPNWWRPRALK